MLKKDVTYEDFDGNKVTETFYFNLTEPEILDLETEYEDGLSGMVKTAMETNDRKTLIGVFKKVVLAAYGVRSEDGKRFIKSEQGAVEFSQTAAYPAVFTELASDADAAADFLIGIVPSSIRKEATKAMEEVKETADIAELPQVDPEENVPETATPAP